MFFKERERLSHLPLNRGRLLDLLVAYAGVSPGAPTARGLEAQAMCVEPGASSETLH